MLHARCDQHLDEHGLHKPLSWQVLSRSAEFLPCDYILKTYGLLEAALHCDGSPAALPSKQSLGRRW